MFETVIQKIGAGLLSPVFQVGFSGEARFYWLYTLCGLALAYAVLSRAGRGAEFSRILFDRATWLSKSARNDYWLLFINPVIAAFAISWLLVQLPAFGKAIAGWLHAAGFGAGIDDPWADVAVGLALTFALFVVNDFLRWFVHYLLHRVPVLWEFHKVHHSAEVLNFATARRFHPVEALLTSATTTLGAVVVNGLFIGFFGDRLTVFTLAGANVLWVLFNMAGGVMRHSPFWISFGPRLERWFVSPAMHHIHHSNDPAHYDTNFGGSLAIWDEMFKTRVAAGTPIRSYGIGEETADFRSLSALYFRPFRLAGRRLRGA